MKRQTPLLEIVRDAIETSELSRYQISKRTGIDQAALSRFMHGGSLRVESVEKLCGVLGLRLTVTKVTRHRRGATHGTKNLKVDARRKS